MILINLIVRVLNLDSHISVCTCYATYSSICPAGNFPSLENPAMLLQFPLTFVLTQSYQAVFQRCSIKKVFLEISQNSSFLTKHFQWLLLKVKTSHNLWLLSEWLRCFSFLWPAKRSPKSCNKLLYQHVLESVKLVHVKVACVVDIKLFFYGLILL